MSGIGPALPFSCRQAQIPDSLHHGGTACVAFAEGSQLLLKIDTALVLLVWAMAIALPGLLSARSHPCRKLVAHNRRPTEDARDPRLTRTHAPTAAPPVQSDTTAPMITDEVEALHIAWVDFWR